MWKKKKRQRNCILIFVVMAFGITGPLWCWISLHEFLNGLAASIIVYGPLDLGLFSLVQGSE